MSPKAPNKEGSGFYHALRRFRKSRRKIGLMYTVQEGLKSVIPKRFMRWGSFFLIDSHWPDLTRADISQEGIRAVNPGDADRLAATRALAHPLQDYLARGAKMSLCEMDGEVSSIYVYDTHRHEHWDWLQFDLAEDVLWGTSVWVIPGARGTGLFGHMRSFNAHRLKPEGYHRVLGTVEAWNLPSLRATLKIASIAGTCTYLRLFTFTMVWFDGRLRAGFWRPGHRLVIHSDEIHSVAGEKLGRYKAKRLERHIYGGDN